MAFENFQNYRTYIYVVFWDLEKLPGKMNIKGFKEMFCKLVQEIY